MQFIKKHSKSKEEKVLDIGAGIGTLSFLLYNNFKYFYCVEIQKEVYEILSKNIKLNDLKNIQVINEDINNMLNDKYFEYFDCIISNPPFYTINSGKLRENEILAISKFEIKLNLKEFLNACHFLLKKDKELYFIYPKSREKEILKDKRFEILEKEEILYGKKNFVCIRW